MGQGVTAMPEKIRAAGVLALRFAFLTRYSWLLALAMVALPPLALVAAPALLENLFVLDHPIQMLHVSWITMFCATTMITTLHITTINAIDRFDDYRAACDYFHRAWGTSAPDCRPWFRRPDTWSMLGLGLGASLGMWYVVMSACVSRTAADPGPAWSAFANSTSVGEGSIAWAAWQQALYGLSSTVGVLLVVYLVLVIRQGFFCCTPLAEAPYQYQPPELRTTPPGVTRTNQPLINFLAWIAGPGYFRAVVHQRGDQLFQKIVLAPGHAGLVMMTSLFCGWYGWNYVNGLRHGIVLDESSPFPALFFGMLSLQLIVLLLPGIAFLLDRHRIPILPTLVFTMALLYSVFGTDHFYELNPNPAIERPFQPLPWEEVLSKRAFWQDSEGKRTLVVVDASGGGIQASAWTTQVLTGLHEVYGEPFSRSIGLISAVSGGSVGTAFYLTHRADMSDEFDSPEGGTVLTPEAIDKIRTASRASGLEATCWGIAYPDTLRAVFPPLAWAGIDRGWSIEQSWRALMDRAGPPGSDYGDLRLSRLGERLRGGTLPVPVFNATLVETGQRLLISPALSPTETARLPSGGIEFLKCFPDSHLCLSTAARLSATFPYVTPVARAQANASLPAALKPSPIADLHVADGAYVDNEGAVTSVDWINRLVVHFSRPENLDSRPFDRILLIRIQAFPKELSRTVQAANSFSGWRAAFLGPFDAMMHVRSASQTERGDLEINLLTRATLAELNSAKQRTDFEFRMALAQVDQLESIHESLRRLAAATPGGNSEIDRQFVATDDELRMTKQMLQSSQQRQEQLRELLVESVVFDFHPVDGVRLPMSWKLTARQQQQIDNAWTELVNGNYREQPLSVVDRYFERMTKSQ
jgi:hypothetical protein